MEPDDILTKQEVAKLCGFSVSTLERLLSRGEFPLPSQLSPRRVGWLRSVVMTWRSQRPQVPPRKPPRPKESTRKTPGKTHSPAAGGHAGP